MEFIETKDIINNVISDIYEGHLKPNDRFLSQRELEKKYNVSRGVIREALQVLKLTNVINVIPGKGAFINEMDLEKLINPLGIKININKKTFLDLYAFRILLELWSLRNISNSLSDNKLKELEHIVKNMGNFYKVREDLYILEDFKFHETIISVSGNSVISLFYSFISNILKGYIKMTIKGNEIIKRGYREHKEIVKAIKEKDLEKAAKFLEIHLNNSKEDLLSNIKNK